MFKPRKRWQSSWHRCTLVVLALFLWAGFACSRRPEPEPGVPGGGGDTTVAGAPSGAMETPVTGAGPVLVTLPPLAPVPAPLDPSLPSVSIPPQEFRPAAPALFEPGRYELEFPAQTTGSETAVATDKKPEAGKPPRSRADTKAGGALRSAPGEESDTDFPVRGAVPLPPGRDWQILVGITPPASLDGFFVFGLEYIAGISDVKDRAFSETPELWR